MYAWFPGSPSVMPPCCQKKYASTFSTISATVTTGKRSVGMLSFSGNTSAKRTRSSGACRAARAAPVRRRRVGAA